MRKITRVAIHFLVFWMAAGFIYAEKRDIYHPYEHVFSKKQNVDGTPLLIDGKMEFYLFPGAERTRESNVSLSCGSRIIVSTLKLGVDLLRSWAVSAGR